MSSASGPSRRAAAWSHLRVHGCGREPDELFDSQLSGPQSIGMQRLPLFLLLLGVIFGLSAPMPLQAFGSTHAMAMAGVAQDDMASMPNCKPGISKTASPAPCKCGMAGCIALTASGMALLLPGDASFAGVATAAELVGPIAPSASLRGRSTAPEPEPPSA